MGQTLFIFTLLTCMLGSMAVTIEKAYPLVNRSSMAFDKRTKNADIIMSRIIRHDPNSLFGFWDL